VFWYKIGWFSDLLIIFKVIHFVLTKNLYTFY
jgi:hypothetical protein